MKIQAFKLHLYVYTHQHKHMYVCAFLIIHKIQPFSILIKGFLLKHFCWVLEERNTFLYLMVTLCYLLIASVFGELWRLEPLSLEKKTMWRREMNWLLSVADHIVELVPSRHSLPNGGNVEVMLLLLFF